MRSLTCSYFSPFWLYNGTARIPVLSSEIGKHVCPPKPCLPSTSSSCTSILRSASSGAVKGNWNSLFHIGTHWFSITAVVSLFMSAGTPHISTYTFSAKNLIIVIIPMSPALHRVWGEWERSQINTLIIRRSQTY